MHFLNLKIPQLEQGAYAAASNEEIGIWVRLSAFCATQENGGKIRGCRDWNDRQWMVAAALSQADVVRESKLWKFDAAGNLLVLDYPVKQEAVQQAKRKGGKAGAQKRWGDVTRAVDRSPNGTPIGSPYA